MIYKAYRKNGHVLDKGDAIRSFRDEVYSYQGTFHPRKVTVLTSDGYLREYYANVFDLGIWCVDWQEWTFQLPMDNSI